ncbi:hypothetical protein HNI00_00565 [Thermoleptolyngbya oregonensis NK1-22]|uniref:Uncharacterized protein n=1 Tax=Thermoleptolyngbya oregonensis NK1-22 TaxID=2547457 RepID=A0AA96Y1R3_9CYAN|nr:hypothetical protein [Thermoleptolyngbya oregonensis]WOB41836.1 hypothetical protein HNI00_00565 [Thermoleptolyngbya oregonensis NK1-22]
MGLIRRLQTLTGVTTEPLNLALEGDANRMRSQMHRQTGDRAPEPGQQVQYRQSQQGEVGS